MTAPKRRAHSAAYGVRHSTAPTTAPAVPVWYDDADDEAAAARQGRTGWPWRACAVRARAVRAIAEGDDDDAPGHTQ